MDPGTLYLIPATLGGRDIDAVLPDGVKERIRVLDYFIAENPKSARAFIKLIGPGRPLPAITIERLDHNTPPAIIGALLGPVLAGTDAGLISEAGCPAIADPGALLVRRAHDYRVRVVPLVGPSSVLLALIASGLESQRFAFHGYLPVKRPARDRAIRDIESRSRRNRESQLFIETPYRNAQLLEALLAVCRPDTLLCIATDLTLATASVRTSRIADWATQKPYLKDRPSVFLILSER
ncbi:MAG: SAM-dependent methyltransferase [Betaproteobacteria bacterium RIFCSPLOWO2_02_FULL_63_19]|nr:MAG: SAM-dependent methyltransferase [Betaproteobacteria bacterium RIFCSPLOWO2_02_FULL_63_19]